MDLGGRRRDECEAARVDVVELVAEKDAAPVVREAYFGEREPGRERLHRRVPRVGPRVQVAGDDERSRVLRQRVADRRELRPVRLERQREVDGVHVDDGERARVVAQREPADDGGLRNPQERLDDPLRAARERRHARGGQHADIGALEQERARHREAQAGVLEDCAQRRVEDALLEQDEIVVGAKRAKIALPPGICLLVDVPGEDADRAWIEASIGGSARGQARVDVARAGETLDRDGAIGTAFECARLARQRDAAAKRERERGERRMDEKTAAVQGTAAAVHRLARQSLLRMRRPST